MTLTALPSTTCTFTGIGPYATSNGQTISCGFSPGSDRPVFLAGQVTSTTGTETAHWINSTSYYDLSSSPTLTTRTVNPSYSGGSYTTHNAGSIVPSQGLGINFSVYGGYFAQMERPFSSGAASVYVTPAIENATGSGTLSSNVSGTYSLGGSVVNFNTYPAVLIGSPVFMGGGPPSFVCDPSANGTLYNNATVYTPISNSYTSGLTLLPGLYTQGFTNLEGNVFSNPDHGSQKNVFVITAFSCTQFTATGPIVEVVNSGFTGAADYYISFGGDTAAQTAWAATTYSGGPLITSTLAGFVFPGAGNSIYIVNFITQTYQHVFLVPNGFDATASLCISDSISRVQGIAFDANSGKLWLSSGGFSNGSVNAAAGFYFASGYFRVPASILLNQVSAVANVSPTIGGADFETPFATTLFMQPGTVGGGVGSWVVIPSYVIDPYSGIWDGFGPAQPPGTYTLQAWHPLPTTGGGVYSNVVTYAISGPGETIVLSTASGTLGGTVELTGLSSNGPPLWLDVSLDGGATWETAGYYETASGTFATPYFAIGPILTTENGV